MEAAIELGSAVISFSGEIDMATIDGFEAALAPSVHAGGPVTIDLSRVTFIDSTCIHALIRACAALGDRGCIILHGVHGSLMRVLEITGVARSIHNLHVIECLVLVDEVA
jgi:anti-anti-sigma factor